MDGEQIRIVLSVSLQVEDTDGPGGGEHVLHGGQLDHQIFLRGRLARPLSVGIHRPRSLVLHHLTGSLSGRLGQGATPLPLAKGWHPGFCLGDLLLELLDALLHMSDIVGQLPFCSMVAKKFDLGIADLWLIVRRRVGKFRQDLLRFRT